MRGLIRPSYPFRLPGFVAVAVGLVIALGVASAAGGAWPR